MHLLFPKDNEWKKYLLEELALSDIPTIEDPLFKELAVIKTHSEVDLKNKNLAFSLDAIPNASFVEAKSIGEQATVIVDNLLENKNQDVEKLCVQVFGISEKHGILHSGRCELLAEKIYKKLKGTSFKANRSFWKSNFLLKVVIMPDRSVAYRLFFPEDRKVFFSILSPFPGGFSTISDDKLAPSRAFKKLIEAQLILGVNIHKEDEVLDLGASPGGWSYVAISNGAKVTSVDRSALEENLMSSSLLEFHSGDAFKFEGKEEYDWVISDIICGPLRILELIDKYVVTNCCKHFVFTIKFKGNNDYAVLNEFKEKAAQLSYDVIIRQLNVNKNEVMILGNRLSL